MIRLHLVIGIAEIMGALDVYVIAENFPVIPCDFVFVDNTLTVFNVQIIQEDSISFITQPYQATNVGLWENILS